MMTEPFLYKELFDHALEMIRANPEAPPEELAELMASRFCMKHEGRYFRGPGLKRMRKAKRDRQIIADSGNMDIGQLVAKYDLSRKTIYQIIGSSNES